MVISNNVFYLHKLKRDIERSQDFKNINPLLYKEFCKAINYFTKNQNFDFKKFEDYFFDPIDFMYFAILMTKLPYEYLDKNPTYISEMCSAFNLCDVYPLNIINYALFFLSEPFYSLIIEVNDKGLSYSYLTIFEIVISNYPILGLNEEEKTRLLKMLHALFNETYICLFNNASTLEDIHNVLLEEMRQINSENITFLHSDFLSLNYLLIWFRSNDEEMKKELFDTLIQSELKCCNKLEIIKYCLYTIDEYKNKYSLQLIRGKNDKS